MKFFSACLARPPTVQTCEPDNPDDVRDSRGDSEEGTWAMAARGAPWSIRCSSSKRLGHGTIASESSRGQGGSDVRSRRLGTDRGSLGFLLG
jgi:hypothetical protein